MTVGLSHEKLLAAMNSSYDFVLESITDGFALFDPYDRLTFCNSRFSSMMSPDTGGPLPPGSQYEWILRRLLDQNGIALGGLHAESWLASQLDRHRKPGGSYLQARSDGRIVQITERRALDGGIISICSDVTDFERAVLNSIEDARRFSHSFEAPPVVYWEEDWSGFKIQIDHLLNSGKKDIRRFLNSSPEIRTLLVNEIKWKGFDNSAIDLYRADNRRSLENFLSPAPVASFAAYPDAIASFLEGRRQVSRDTTDWAVDGTELHLIESFQLPSNDDTSWSSVMASSQPIIDFRQGMVAPEENGSAASDRSSEKFQSTFYPVRHSPASAKLLDFKSIQASTFETVLDSLSVAVLLIGANLQIIHANTAAQTLLEASDPIGSLAGVLKPQSQQVTAALRAVLQTTSITTVAAGDHSHRISAPSANGDPFILHVLTLKHRPMPVGLSPKAIAAIFVTPAIGQSESPDAALAALFNLTRMETRVLSEVAAGSTLATVARTLNIGSSTVRTHLLKVFSKTGTRRQADLVRLVASLAFPL